jgi:hypothetical protein
VSSEWLAQAPAAKPSASADRHARLELAPRLAQATVGGVVAAAEEHLGRELRLDVALQAAGVLVVGVESDEVLGLPTRLCQVAERGQRSSTGDPGRRVVNPGIGPRGPGQQLVELAQAAPWPPLPELGGGEALADARVARTLLEEALEGRLPGGHEVLEEQQPAALDLGHRRLPGNVRQLVEGGGGSVEVSLLDRRPVEAEPWLRGARALAGHRAVQGLRLGRPAQCQVGVRGGETQPEGSVVPAQRVLPQGGDVLHALGETVGEQEVARGSCILRVGRPHGGQRGDRRLRLVALGGGVEHRLGPPPAHPSRRQIPLQMANERGAFLPFARQRVLLDPCQGGLGRPGGGQVVRGEPRRDLVVGAQANDLATVEEGAHGQTSRLPALGARRAGRRRGPAASSRAPVESGERLLDGLGGAPPRCSSDDRRRHGRAEDHHEEHGEEE